jgi:hypothetical protein
MGYSLREASLILMFYEASGIISGLIGIWIIFTQFDLALIEGIVQMVVIYFWTIPEWVRNKKINE